MCASKRRIDPALIEQILEAPTSFEFFQLVRLLELAYVKSETHGATDRVKFRNSVNLGFAPSQVESLNAVFANDPEESHGPLPDKVEIATAFMGMLGINGALPVHYTEQLIHTEKLKRDSSARAFFDIFSNRALRLFYQAWKKYNLHVQYEADRKNQFLPPVLALAGMGFGSLRDRLRQGPGRIDDESIAYYAGLLRQRPVSAEILTNVLGGYFRVPVRVGQFVGRWYVIPKGKQSLLGGSNALLGKNLLLGERVWQRNLRVRLMIGPLPLAKYVAFLPKGELSIALSKLLALATGGQFEYEINPILRAEDVRTTRLGRGSSVRLGFDSFLVTAPQDQPRHDAAYEIHPLH
jgi:type VI secretion system protein ImpH